MGEENAVALAAISLRIHALEKARADAVASVGEIALRLEEVCGLRKALGGDCVEAGAEASLEKEVGVTEAVVALLEERPYGMRAVEIAEMLKEKIRTDSGNPRRLIMSVVDGMRRKGRLTKNLVGKVFLTPGRP